MKSSTMMNKFMLGLVFVFLTLGHKTWADPVEEDKSSTSDGDDMKTSETFGFGYYQPSLYTPVHQPTPFATVGAYNAVPFPPTVSSYPVVRAPLASTTTVLSSAGNARSAYDYGSGSGYKYGGAYGFNRRWGYGSGAASRGSITNEVYRRHPVYVAWG
ncbi:uncharacterized protein LOC142238533 [Haematobia irritans]|uniref:uncharacterized protein LOC142238533 n=1 Tax=Haematobia irritans TaxID=7368 RepID=UPI003F4FE810